MKYFRLILSATLFQILLLPVFAQQDDTSHKEVWLFNIPTPYILDKGVMEYELSWRYTNYSKPDPRTEMGEMIFLGSYGITNRVGILVIAPYGWIDSNKYGMADVSIALKYKLVQSKTLSVSLSPNIYLPAGKKDDFLGGDKINYQVDANLGFRKSDLGIVVNVGYGYKSFLFPANQEITNQGAFMLSGALSFRMLPSITLVLEAIGQTVPKFSDDDFYFQVGGVFTLRKTLLLKGSLGVGLPRDSRANTDQRATFGLCYLLK